MRWIGVLMALHTLYTWSACCLIDEDFSEHKFAGNTATPGTPGTLESDYLESSLEPTVEPGSNNAGEQTAIAPPRLTAVGTPSSATTLDLTIIDGGYPDEDASFSWSDDSGTTQYGWDLDRTIGFQTVVHDASGTTGYQAPHAASALDGTVIVAAEDWVAAPDRVVSIAGTQPDSDGETATWSAPVEVWETSTAFDANNHANPCVISKPGVWEIVSIEYSGGSGWLRKDISKNDGTSWSNAGKKLLEFPTTASIHYDKLRVVYDPKSATYTLVVRRNNAGTYTGLHYVSNGGKWTAGSTTADVRGHDLVCVNGTVVYVYVTESGAAVDDVSLKRKTANQITWTTVDISSYTIQTFEYNVALAVTPDSRIYLFNHGNVDAGTKRCVASHDLGTTWTSMTGESDYSSLGLEESAASVLTSGIYTMSAVYASGSFLLIGNLACVTATLQYSIAAIRVGGYSNFTHINGSGYLYTPTDVPSDRGWTYTGAAAETLGAATLDYTITAVVQQGYSELTLAGGNYLNAMAVGKPTSGGSLASDAIAFQLEASNGGAATVIASIRLTATQIQVYDVQAAALVGAPVTITSGAPIEVTAYLADAVLSVYWRDLHGVKWETVIEGQALTDGAFTGNRCVRIGAVTAGSTSASTWYLVRATVATENMANGYSVRDLYGVPVSTKPWLLRDGVSVMGRGGPFEGSDVYQVTTHSQRGLWRALNILTSPSPRQAFVSGEDALPEGYHQVVLDMGAAYEGRISDWIGLAVLGVDGADGFWLDRYTGAAWSNLLTMPMLDSVVPNLAAWTRDSVTDLWLRPDGTNGNARIYREDELVGRVARVKDTAGTIVYDRVVHNTAGSFSNTSGSKQMHIRFSGTPLLGTWGAMLQSSAAAASSGVGAYAKQALVLGYQGASSSRYYRLRWSHGPWATSATIGKILPLKVIWLPKQADVGAQVTYRSNDEVVKLPFGYSLGRQLAPSTRDERAPFRAVVVQDNRYVGGVAIDSQGSNSTPMAALDSNLDALITCVERNGQSKPLIWIREVDLYGTDLTAANLVLRGGDDWLYGRIVDVTATPSKGYLRGTRGGAMVDTDLAIEGIV